VPDADTDGLADYDAYPVAIAIDQTYLHAQTYCHRHPRSQRHGRDWGHTD
jgi:hypothetical protein